MDKHFEYGDTVIIKRAGFLEGKLIGTVVGNIIKLDGTVYYNVRTNSAEHICHPKDLTLIKKDDWDV